MLVNLKVGLEDPEEGEIPIIAHSTTFGDEVRCAVVMWDNTAPEPYRSQYLHEARALAVAIAKIGRVG